MSRSEHRGSQFRYYRYAITPAGTEFLGELRESLLAKENEDQRSKLVAQATQDYVQAVFAAENLKLEEVAKPLSARSALGNWRSTLNCWSSSLVAEYR